MKMEKEKGITTIRVHSETKKELREFEVHPRESNESILKRLIVLYGKYMAKKIEKENKMEVKNG